MSLLVISCLY